MSPCGVNSPYLDQRHIPNVAHQKQGLTNWDNQSDAVGKPVRSEVISSLSNEGRAALDDQISSLKRDYGLSDEDVVTDFLVRHRAIRTVLQDAVPRLRETFGDRVFNLEVSKDEDGCETMYAVAIWPEGAWRASEALHNFLEKWWLHRMNAATSDLAVVYKLV